MAPHDNAAPNVTVAVNVHPGAKPSSFPPKEPARTSADQQGEELPSRWAGVFSMSLCVFALTASEFMPVSLLTPMVVDLAVSEGLAGQGLAISGAFAMVASLAIPALAGRRDRKTILLALTALMCASGGVIALADSYPVYMAGRAVIGIVVGGFWLLAPI